MNTSFSAAALAFAIAIIPSPAFADEVFGGVYAHGVETPFTFDTGEGGVDVQGGYRFAPIEQAWDIEPYVIASLNTQGDTSFAGAGISRKFDLGPVYLRPGVGLVIHDAPAMRVSEETGFRTDLGSRVLFEPEIAIGTRVSDRVSVEASWVHISQAQLFDGQQNPGIDMMGIRVNLKL